MTNRSNTENIKIWFVIGASKVLRLLLTKQLLAVGHRVVATARSTELFKPEAEPMGSNLLPLTVDLIDQSSVQNYVGETLAHFSQIDVVVNNSRFGKIGTLKKLGNKEVRKNFHINVFRMLNVIRALAPYMRLSRSDHIINISSMAGI
ncbi:SDR family NAD(P)-dependent oxidoreductase [Flavobacterium collinsii]|uniref:SDR family NAD(P)-dependent oxidoreductase n=1 Tax=Flavobacterium collinsii TaxID=1114861 RepID=UPI0037571405